MNIARRKILTMGHVKAGTHVLCKSCSILHTLNSPAFKIHYYVYFVLKPYYIENKFLSCLQNSPPLECFCSIHELTLEEKKELAV